MYTLLMIFSIVIAALLIIAVLMQSSKGGGLAGTFGGSGSFGSVFGTRRTADFLSKTTWWLGGLLLVLAVVINLFFLKPTSASKSVIQESGSAVPSAPSLPQSQPAPQK